MELSTITTTKIQIQVQDISTNDMTRLIRKAQEYNRDSVSLVSYSNATNFLVFKVPTQRAVQERILLIDYLTK